MGTTCIVKYTNVAKDYKVTTADGKTVKAERISDDRNQSFPYSEGGVYVIVSKTADAIATIQRRRTVTLLL